MSHSDNKSRENYLRVTHVLYPFSGLDKVDPEVVAKAGKRGTRVHQICEAIMSGLGEIGVDEETAPYVESFKQWWDEKFNVVEIEKRFYCDEHQITGQSDMLIEGDDGLTIYDIKTSSRPSPTWEAQGSAYYYLAKKSGYDVKNVRFIHLNRDGKAPKIFEYPADSSFFLDVLRVYKHFFFKGNNGTRSRKKK